MRPQGRPAPNFRQFNNKLEKFDGTQDWEVWWSDACGYFQQFDDLDETHKVKLINAAIVGNAKLVLESGGLVFKTSEQINESE